MIAIAESYLNQAKGSANDDWYIHPDHSGVKSIEQMVADNVTAIISLHYPAPEGSTLKCNPHALKKLGSALFITLHNMVTEVQYKNTSIFLNISWHDGVPTLQVKSSNIIIP